MRPLFLVLMIVLAGCGDAGGPCVDPDPIGPCATSHGRTYGGIQSPHHYVAVAPAAP